MVAISFIGGGIYYQILKKIKKINNDNILHKNMQY
jgi:hypothetical protein